MNITYVMFGDFFVEDAGGFCESKSLSREPRLFLCFIFYVFSYGSLSVLRQGEAGEARQERIPCKLQGHMG